jgi:hypothetical protein
MKLNFSIERKWNKRQFPLFEMGTFITSAVDQSNPKNAAYDCLRFRFLAVPDLSGRHDNRERNVVA